MNDYRNTCVTPLDEMFWERAFTLNTTLLTTDKLDTTSSQPFQKEEEATLILQNVREVTPTFLQPVIHYVLLAGKSMELLQSLCHLPLFTASVDVTRKTVSGIYLLQTPDR